MEVINLINIKLPSVNSKFGVNRKTNRLFLSEEYKVFKELLSNCCRCVIIPPPYRVQIVIETYKDIDACVKLITDSLQNRCIGNDRDILEMFIRKIPVQKGENDKLRVYVETIK